MSEELVYCFQKQPKYRPLMMTGLPLAFAAKIEHLHVYQAFYLELICAILKFTSTQGAGMLYHHFTTWEMKV